MDEIEAAHMGKVDEWRVMRVQAYQIALSSGNYKNTPTEQEMFPLPYDEEPEENVDWITTFYENAIK